MTTHNISLSADEGLAVGSAAIMQMMRATQKGWVGSDHGGTSGRSIRERWAQAIHGMMAEFAACKFLGVCWTAGVSGIQGSDALGIEIRATPWENGKLIINESDVEKHPDHPFVLIVGHWPNFRLCGWITAQEAARDKWFKADERPPSFWVAQSDLHDMSDLRIKDSRTRNDF